MQTWFDFVQDWDEHPYLVSSILVGNAIKQVGWQCRTLSVRKRKKKLRQPLIVKYMFLVLIATTGM